MKSAEKYFKELNSIDMPRLDQQRQKRLEPKRIKYAVSQITSLGYEITYRDETTIKFMYAGKRSSFSLIPVGLRERR